jgi:hypothetical protein
MNLTMSHTKCQKCQKNFNVAELKEKPEGVGRICINDIACKKRQEEKKFASNPTLKPTR